MALRTWEERPEVRLSRVLAASQAPRRCLLVRDYSVEERIVTAANRNPLCGTDWGRLLSDEFDQQYWGELVGFVEEERSLHPDSVYPPANEVFRALELTWCQQTGVVIVGQDPYYKQPGQAHGLCFSVPCGERRPQSLVRIHTELRTDVHVRTPGHGSLVPWAHRGALLLNTTLTVSAGEPPSLTRDGDGSVSPTR